MNNNMRSDDNIGNRYMPEEADLSVHCLIGLDKSEYQGNNFLISPQKHILWVHIRCISPRHFYE